MIQVPRETHCSGHRTSIVRAQLLTLSTIIGSLFLQFSYWRDSEYALFPCVLAPDPADNELDTQPPGVRFIQLQGRTFKGTQLRPVIGLLLRTPASRPQRLRATIADQPTASKQVHWFWSSQIPLCNTVIQGETKLAVSIDRLYLLVCTERMFDDPRNRWSGTRLSRADYCGIIRPCGAPIPSGLNNAYWKTKLARMALLWQYINHYRKLAATAVPPMTHYYAFSG